MTEAGRKRHSEMRKAGPGKWPVAKQYLNPKMPKCHFNVHLGAKDRFGLFCSTYVGEIRIISSNKTGMFVSAHCNSVS